MEKVIKLAVCCLGLMVFIACGEKKSSVIGADGKEYTSYQDACKANDFEAAHVFLDNLYSSYEDAVRENTDFNGDAGNVIKGEAASYCTAANYVYSAELRFLANMDEDESWRRALSLVKEMNVVGIKYPKDKENIWPDGSCYFIECYQKYIELRNRQCDILLDLAIDYKKQDVANNVLRCFCENCKTTGGIPSLVYYEKDDIDAAKEKYDEAIASGAFN